jgi:alkylation response protein AidB-like acyl-CoA dehydrogenase
MVADGVPDMRFAFAPRDQIQFHGNWNVSGLVGTGSVDYLAGDLFVPEELIVPLTGAAPVRSEPMYHMGLAGLAATARNAVVLGMMRGALREVAQLTAGKTRQGYLVPVSDYPVFQYEFAQHEAEYQAARAYALSIVETAQQFAEREGSLSLELVARVQQSANWSHKVAGRVVNFARLWSGSQAGVPGAEPDGGSSVIFRWRPSIFRLMTSTLSRRRRTCSPHGGHSDGAQQVSVPCGRGSDSWRGFKGSRTARIKSRCESHHIGPKL